MLKAGLTGGMACGKSFVATILRQLGCYILEADEVAREVIAPDGEAYDEVLEVFGADLLDEDKRINRTRLAERVFGHPDRLDKLNSIVHPAVRARALRDFEEIGARDRNAIIIYVAAILLESGAYREVDKIIVVTCTREQQIERAMHRPGANLGDVLARLERQMPLDEKIKHADFVIDTSGQKEDTLRQTERLYEELRRLA